MTNSFKTLSSFKENNKSYSFYSLGALADKYDVERLPYSLKILLENMLRKEDGISVSESDIIKLLNWDPKATPTEEIAFTPSRVILQDFTGVPAVVDLAAMRDAMQNLGGNPKKINPLSPVELVIDHSVMVDAYGNAKAFAVNKVKEFERNRERYEFLRWGQDAFDNFRVVPPGTGIVHQVNLEYLARVVFDDKQQNNLAYPDTLVGTDSHTTMINGLGVLGWGVGGIEAEAAMLGQPLSMLIPQVVGFKLIGALPEGTTATDLVLRVVEILREKGVVGKFVEFFGNGLGQLPLADRATIANMAPEYGATCGIFPIDNETLRFLALSGRSDEQIKLVETYAKQQSMFRTGGNADAVYSDVITLDLNTITPSIAGPKRPQDRINLLDSKKAFANTLDEIIKTHKPKTKKDSGVSCTIKGETYQLKHGTVVIAAITSCTNTSNPDVMIAAGLLAKKANALGLSTKPWVKTSLAPGSQVVTDYLQKSKLLDDLDKLGFNIVGYGCTTCIGNSGPLPDEVAAAIKEGELAVAAVLSGNRNFEGRIHPDVRTAYLASPPLCVAYAIAGTMNIDLYNEPLATSKTGKDVFLRDIWPSQQEIRKAVDENISASMFQHRYETVFSGDENWQAIKVSGGENFDWQDDSTYVKNPPYFTNMNIKPSPISNIKNAHVLALLGDSVTTDHISPAGSISLKSPAAAYLQQQGVEPQDFNSYGSRRGNHEVMMRGTFANTRLKNLLAPGTEGGFTVHLPSNEQMSIYDAAMKYQQQNQPLIVVAGKEYGTGSSRDWAAKGTMLLGVKAVIAASFERIHRSNLIGMGVLPLQFVDGDNHEKLGLTGKETFSIDLSNLKPQCSLKVTANTDGKQKEFTVTSRIDTPKELEYYQHGGILHYVLRNLAKG